MAGKNRHRYGQSNSSGAGSSTSCIRASDLDNIEEEPGDEEFLSGEDENGARRRETMERGVVTRVQLVEQKLSLHDKQFEDVKGQQGEVQKLLQYITTSLNERPIGPVHGRDRGLDDRESPTQQRGNHFHINELQQGDGGHGSKSNRDPKVDVQYFSGEKEEDVTNWLFQLEHYFAINGITYEDRLSYAVVYMKGEAMSWWRWFEKMKRGRVRWRDFHAEILMEFGPYMLEDPMSTMAKLQQHDTVQEYHREFRKWSNLVNDLPESHMVSCFVSGLKEEIKVEVQMSNPEPINMAYRLAVGYEKKVAIHKKCFRGQNFKGAVNTGGQKSDSAAKNPPFRRLTPNEILEKKKKGLCFRCDEKYSDGHKCKAIEKVVMLIKGDSGWDTEDEQILYSPQQEQ